MVTVEKLKNYLRLLPDEDDAVVEMCLDAAIQKAKDAGVPAYDDNPHYDMFICALAGFWYDNRNLSIDSTGTNAEINMRKMINAFVLELRGGRGSDG